MPEAIRVAHVMGKMVGGGLEQVVMNYYRHIDRSRVQFDFIVDEDSTLVPGDEIESLGGRVFVVPPYQHVIAYQRALVALFREQGWTVVHSHENALSVFPLRAAKRAGVPVRIAHSHSTSGRGEPARNAMKAVLKRFSNIYPTHRMACSRHAGEWLFGRHADFEVLYNAIELQKFDFDASAREKVRRELGISPRTLAVGHIGRFMPQKNHAYLVEVFSDVLRMGVDAKLVLVGEGELKPETMGLVERAGISECVLFLGQRDDVARLYQAFDVFCLPSIYEGLGIVAIEAQRAGLPCLLSERVPREADVTGDARFIPLSQRDAWSREVAGVEVGMRIPVREDSFSDYDIDRAATRLADMYGAMAREAGRGEMSHE